MNELQTDFHPDSLSSPIVRKLTSMTPLSREEAGFLEDIQGSIRQFSPDTTFIRDGDEQTRAYVLRSGWAIRYAIMDDGRRQILSFALPGDVLGIHTGFRRKATYNAASITRLEVGLVRPNDLFEISRRFPRLGAGLNWCTAREFSILGDQALRLGRMTAYERVAHLILELYHRQALIGMIEGDWMEFPLTQNELADALGLSLVHINRQLMRLRREGLIETGRKRMRVKNLSGLKAATEFHEGHLQGFAA